MLSINPDTSAKLPLKKRLCHPRKDRSWSASGHKRRPCVRWLPVNFRYAPFATEFVSRCNMSRRAKCRSDDPWGNTSSPTPKKPALAGAMLGSGHRSAAAISLARIVAVWLEMPATIAMAAPTVSASTHQRRGLLPSAERIAIWNLRCAPQTNASGQRMFPIAKSAWHWAVPGGAAPIRRLEEAARFGRK